MIPIGDGDVNRFPDGDGDGDEAEKRGWGCVVVYLEHVAYGGNCYQVAKLVLFLQFRQALCFRESRGKDSLILEWKTADIISIDSYESFEGITYLEGECDSILICKRDFQLLQPEKFINDTIVDFYVE
ncbi:hypothetical protein Tco_0269003 [Tanacetum coccineum]